MTTEADITPKSSIEELFAVLTPDSGMRVVPITIPPKDGVAQMAIVIVGKEEDANVLMANLMHYVNEMAAVAQQHEADQAILGADGRPAGKEPQIIVPK